MRRKPTKNVIKCFTITNGIATAKQEITTKWKSKNYVATVIQTSNYVTFVCCTNHQPLFCDFARDLINFLTTENDKGNQ